MFYCDACQRQNEWPEGFLRSYGPCEVCGKPSNCSDVPSSWLPSPKRQSTIKTAQGAEK